MVEFVLILLQLWSSVGGGEGSGVVGGWGGVGGCSFGLVTLSFLEVGEWSV